MLPPAEARSPPTKYARLIGIVIAAAALHGRAPAQCLDWSHGFGVKDGVQGVVRSLLAFDDGHGPALYIGGSLTVAGDVQAKAIATWSAGGWSSVGGGLSSSATASVNAMVVFDDGTGPALYVGGYFDTAGSTPAANVARWNGTSWSALGEGLDHSVQSLCVFDDGTGPALYAGGYFTHTGTAAADHLARWDGTSWAPLAAGSAGVVNSAVYAMTVFDDGNGPQLYVGGLFWIAGGLGTNRLARWNGTYFTTVGPAAQNGIVGSQVAALAVFDDGSGPALFMGGLFFSAGGVPAKSIAKWDGSTWSALGSGVDGGTLNVVDALTVFDDGGGSALYAGGNFANAGGIPSRNVARWDGAGWSGLGGGVGDYYAFALAGFDDGSGPALYAGGSFNTAGSGSAQRLARWRGSSWSALTIDGPGGMNGPVYALETFDDGAGPALYVGGGFTKAGTTTANHIARWRNGAWTALGAGLDGDVYALNVFNDGSGLALYAGGYFTTSAGAPVSHIAKWNGSSWVALGNGVDDSVRALAVFNDGTGPALYAGGDFTQASGAPAHGLARWKSSTWSDVGGGLGAPPSVASVRALSVFDAGTGSLLVVGGSFSQAGGNGVSNFAVWNGSVWWIGVPGPDGVVQSFAVFDFGGAPALYVGGSFYFAGGQAARGVAVWTGNAWWPVGGGLNGSVSALSVFDDGSGPALFAGGTFVGNQAGSFANRAAQWNGALWLPLGAGLGSPVNALAVFQEASSEPGLYAGGTFTSAGALASVYIARWRGCAGIIDAYCFGDGSLASCPCGIPGGAGRGCQNSAFTGGARLEVTGSAQPDTLVLRSSGELPHALSVFLQGDGLQSPTPFGDGWLCVGGTTTQLYKKAAVNGSASAPDAGEPSVSARSAALGDPIAPGSTRYYQTYYRDPNLAFCPPPLGDTWNVTNGVRITW